MKLGLAIVWSDRHRLQEPGEEVWIGVRTPGTEVPRRAEAGREAFGARDAPFADARAHRAEDVLAIRHTPLVNPAVALTGAVDVDADRDSVLDVLALADETGENMGASTNRKVPRTLADDASLGPRVANRAPRSPPGLHRDARRARGATGVRSVLVEKGGLTTMGAPAAETLAGLHEGATRA